MECHRCKTAELINESQKCFKGEIPEEIRGILQDICLCCSHGCRTCRNVVRRGGRRRSVYAHKRALQEAILRYECVIRGGKGAAEALASLSVSPNRQAQKSAPSRVPPTRAGEPDSVIAAKAELANLLRSYCYRCEQSQDDNPAHRGITFVSKDAGNGTDDPNVQLEDWLLAQRETDANEAYRDGCTDLPPDVENKLRVQLAAFAQLSFYDKMLVCVLLTMKPGTTNRHYTLAEFARLDWLWDPEISRVFSLSGLRLSVEGAGLSKQAAHTRYRSIVARVPTLASVAWNYFQSAREAAKGQDPTSDPETADSEVEGLKPNFSTAIRSAADSVDPLDD